MKTIELYGENRFQKWSKTRHRCRGIVIKANSILLSYETKENTWMIPGGGVEENESLEECCIREVQEETGYITSLSPCVLKIVEYYEEWKFVSYYYICNIVGKTERKLTKREQMVGMEPRFISIDEAIEIFSKHNDYKESDEMKRGLYEREYKALCDIVKILKKERD